MSTDPQKQKRAKTTTSIPALPALFVDLPLPVHFQHSSAKTFIRSLSSATCHHSWTANRHPRGASHRCTKDARRAPTYGEPMDSQDKRVEEAGPHAAASAQDECPRALATGKRAWGERVANPPRPTESPTAPMHPRYEWRPNPTGEEAQLHVWSQSNSSRAEGICRY